MPRFLSSAVKLFPERIPKAAVLGVIVLISLGILTGAHSVTSLYRSLAEVGSLYLDIQALSVDGDLQYQIQESRVRFLHIMIPATTGDDRLVEIAHVRDADLQVSLLTGKAAILTSGPARLRPFSVAWAQYDDVKDDIIALVLQGRFADALAMEKARGSAAFDLASEAIGQAKQQLDQSSAARVEAVWSALRWACLEGLGLLAAAVIFVAALLAVEVKRRGIMRSLLSATQTLRASEARFRTVFEEATVGMMVTDIDGSIVSVNNAVEEITRYPRGELIGRPSQFIMSDSDQRDSAGLLDRLMRGEVRTYRAERQIVRKDGTGAWMRTSVSLVRKDGHPINVIALCEDISEQKRAQEQLSYQATHDVLTGLPNRRSFEEALEGELKAAAASGGESALLYLDLDGFKLVNDTYGHVAGDLLLGEVGRRLAGRLDPGEILARVGGDEFAIVRPRVIPEPGGDNRESPEAVLARKLLDTLRRPFLVNQKEIHIGASIGISRYPVDGADASSLLQCADSAMYHAKRDKHGYHFFDAKMQQAVHRRLKVERLLHGALERHELSVAFQPQYDLSTETLIRFEALCRWQNPELGSVSPSEFIPAAEETGLIAEVGRYVLRQACIEASRWQESGRSAVRVAVNVSPAQFRRRNYVEEVQETLRETSFPAKLLELEITESTLMADLDESIRRMHELRAMGIGISIDDFGTGYSSLSYLQNMPVKSLKIDPSFTLRLDHDGAAETMIRSIIAMGHALGLRVVSEGVENERQMKLLRELGSDEVQGYYFGKPENAKKALERVLRECSSPVLLEV